MKLIVEMEMPQNCFECNFHCVGQFCDGMGYCSAVPPYCDDDCRPCEEKRPDWCPIKGEISEIELMHLEEERAFAARNIAAERKDDEKS